MVVTPGTNPSKEVMDSLGITQTTTPMAMETMVTLRRLPTDMANMSTQRT